MGLVADGYNNGMFPWLAHTVARRPVVLLIAWALLITAAVLSGLYIHPIPLNDSGSFLPPQAPHNQAVELLREAFPRWAANSYMAVIICRPAGLTQQDMAWLDRLAQEGGQKTHGQVLTPSMTLLRGRLMSRDGQAAVAMINLKSNFISETTVEGVKEVARLAERGRPAGLEVEISGTAGIGHDYIKATERASLRTTIVTISAVLLILVLVYRSPLGGLVPLVAIGASTYLAFRLLDLLSHIGWEASTMQRIFCVVLIFGAGIDYALFWISRYREELGGLTPFRKASRSETFEDGACPPPTSAKGTVPISQKDAKWGQSPEPDYAAAAAAAMRRTGPAILASAATIICALTTMLTAELIPSRHAGRVLAFVITLALIAALTLTPALARALGRWLFWPMGPQARPGPGQRLVWPVLAEAVTRRPGTVLAIGGIALLLPAAWALRIQPRFDSLSELPPDSSSARGYDLALAHFAKGQFSSNNLLLEWPTARGPKVGALRAAQLLTERIRSVPGVVDVYSLSSPIGASQQGGNLLAGVLTPFTRQLYDSRSASGQPVLRLEVLLDYLPFSPEAIRAVETITARARAAGGELTSADGPPGVLVQGPTGYIMGVRAVAGADQRRVMLLATAVITVIVLMLVRDVPLTLFMVLTTWLTYGAALTVSQFFFVDVLHEPGLDWKVRLILFVIVVSVGQDYNIFLVSRLLDVRAARGPREAVREAIIKTGSVISSCGLIMAATLGSLWAGQLLLLRQLGFALALGVLMDTFFVRPLLIPSFFLALRGARPASVPGEGPQSHSFAIGDP